MLGRKVSKWLRSLAWAGVVGGGISLGDGPLGVAYAQPPMPPTLPPTKVEGQPPTLPPTTVPGTPPTDPTPLPPPPDLPLTGAPVSSGGVFASPVADGYRAESATSGTRIDIPLIDYPGSISVLPQQLIRDQQALRVNDLIRDIGAAVQQGDFRRDSINVRGFELTGDDNRWNGFRDPFAPYRDLQNVQRIEVLKGPASFLYGAGQPAGVINWITKKPLSTSYNDVNFSVGSFGLVRTTIDSTGPIDEQGRLLFRVNGAYEHADGFRDFGFNERSFVAPSFTYLIDENTALTFDYQYLNDRRRFDSGIISQNGQIVNVPRTRFFNESNDYQRMEDQNMALTFTHRFNEDWSARIGGFATWISAPEDGTVPFFDQRIGNPSALNPILGFAGLPPFSNTTIYRQRQVLDKRHEQYGSVIADLNGKITTGPIKHNFLIGTELGWKNGQFHGALSDPLGGGVLGPFPSPPFPQPFIPLPQNPFDYANPVYGLPPAPLVGEFNSTLQQQQYGFYAQDFMEVTEKWKVLAGVRFDVLNQHFGNSLTQPIAGQLAVNLPFTEANSTFYRTTPRVGVVYQPIPEVVSFYGSYAMSFDPPATGVVSNPGMLIPETGDTWEGGVKLDLLDNRLSLTAAGFYITKNNVLVLDPNSFFLLTQVGQQRSQGFEFGAVGWLTDRWSVLANYAYVDARVLQNLDPTIIGNTLSNVPYNNANLWTRYNVIDDGLNTLGLAMGAVFVGERAADLTNTVDLPGYLRWDAGVMYRRGNLYANLYVENVFDRDYFTGAQNTLSIFPGAPLTARAQIGFTF